jgi:peptidoglycan/LPS O-acetylase OafA/YrhL
VAPFVAWNVSQASPRYDRSLGNLAYPLYLFHWIPREWYFHLSLPSDATWKHDALLTAYFLAATIGALLIYWLIDQPLDNLRSSWVNSRKIRAKTPAEESVTSPSENPGSSPA